MLGFLCSCSDTTGQLTNSFSFHVLCLSFFASGSFVFIWPRLGTISSRQTKSYISTLANSSAGARAVCAGRYFLTPRLLLAATVNIDSFYSAGCDNMSPSWHKPVWFVLVGVRAVARGQGAAHVTRYAWSISQWTSASVCNVCIIPTSDWGRQLLHTMLVPRYHFHCRFCTPGEGQCLLTRATRREVLSSARERSDNAFFCLLTRKSNRG